MWWVSSGGILVVRHVCSLWLLRCEIACEKLTAHPKLVIV